MKSCLSLLALVLLGALLLTACSPVVPIGGEAPTSAADLSQAGPYTDLVYQPEAAIRTQLGEPDEISGQGKTFTWVYRERQISLPFVEGIVAFVYQSAGRISPELTFADDEERLKMVAREGQPDPFGAKRLFIEKGNVITEIFVRDGRIQGVKIGPPSMP